MGWHQEIKGPFRLGLKKHGKFLLSIKHLGNLLPFRYLDLCRVEHLET